MPEAVVLTQGDPFLLELAVQCRQEWCDGLCMGPSSWSRSCGYGLSHDHGSAAIVIARRGSPQRGTRPADKFPGRSRFRSRFWSRLPIYLSHR